MPSKYDINFLPRQSHTITSINKLKIIGVGVGAIYILLVAVWLGLKVYQVTLLDSGQTHEATSINQLFKQKRHLINTLQRWDKQYQQQINLVATLQWAMQSRFVRQVHYQEGQLTIQGVARSQQMVNSFMQGVNRHYNQAKIPLNQLNKNASGQWSFTLEGQLHD